MRHLLLFLVLSTPVFAQVDPSSVAQLPNRGDSLAVRMDTQSLLNYCHSHRLADFSFERGQEYCTFSCTTAALVCAKPIQIILPEPVQRYHTGSSIVRAIRPRRHR